MYDSVTKTRKQQQHTLNRHNRDGFLKMISLDYKDMDSPYNRIRSTVVVEMLDVRRCTMTRLLYLLLIVSIAAIFLQQFYLTYIHTARTDATRTLRATTASMKNSTEVKALPQVKKVLSSEPTVAARFNVEGGIKTVFRFGQLLQLLSAVAGNSSRNASWDTVVIQGWENKTLINRTYVCCFLNGDKFIYTRLRTKVHWGVKSGMAAKQFLCPVPKSLTELQGVTLSGNRNCITRKNWYLPIEKAYKHEDQVAICAKLVYGKVSADDLLSWFEFHRRLGADRVVMFTNNVNAAAQRVLWNYRSLGILETHNFQTPSKGPLHPSVGVKNSQAWNDEQLVVFDCLERLKGYKYLIMLDIDEYLVPTLQNETLKHLFDKIFQRNQNAAGFTFKTQLYLTTWGVTGDGKSPFNVMRYVNRTRAMTDRTKHVTMPSRLSPGGLSTHHFTPLYSKGYKRASANSQDVLLRHYRSCRKEWEKKESSIKCGELDRYTDWTVYRMLQPIHDRLLQLRRHILAGAGPRTKDVNQIANGLSNIVCKFVEHVKT